MKPCPKNAASLLTASTAALLVLAGSVGVRGQTPGQTVSRSVVVLDPAHGGPDAGARLGEHLLEKDVTLALAARLRTALTAQGFTVVSTRDADAAAVLTNDQRAETANRAHAVACVVIHATGSGSGVHVYTSALASKVAPAADDTDDTYRPAFEPVPWDQAQAESIPQSLRLANDLSAGLRTANLPVLVGRVQVAPLDNLICPAVAVEVAPLVIAGADTTPVTDANYQQQVAETLARAVAVWRGHADAGAAAATGGSDPARSSRSGKTAGGTAGAAAGAP